jgi:hypothetical protein
MVSDDDLEKGQIRLLEVGWILSKEVNYLEPAVKALVRRGLLE